MTTADTSLVRGTPASKLGTVGKLEDGRCFVLFERHLGHPIDKVWAAITDPGQLARWFPGFKLELKEGGHFDIWFSGENCEGPSHVNGIVTRYEPPRVLECGSMRFELETEGSGCLLRFTDILQFDGSMSKPAFTNSVLGGWHRFLDALEAALAGHTFDHDQPEFDYASIDVPGRQ